MFRALRNHLTPSTAIAFVALVFAITGGAFAATGSVNNSGGGGSHGTLTASVAKKKAKPKPKGGARGPAGPKGAPGATGPAGPRRPQRRSVRRNRAIARGATDDATFFEITPADTGGDRGCARVRFIGAGRRTGPAVDRDDGVPSDQLWSGR